MIAQLRSNGMKTVRFQVGDGEHNSLKVVEPPNNVDLIPVERRPSKG